MTKAFRIVNHNKYTPISREYDEYSMVITAEGYGGDLDALKLGYLDQQDIVDELRYDICDDIESFIKINIPPAIFNSALNFLNAPSFGLFVFEPERSTFIKLTYN
jgi:hypothetical protein